MEKFIKFATENKRDIETLFLFLFLYIAQYV